MTEAKESKAPEAKQADPKPAKIMKPQPKKRKLLPAGEQVRKSHTNEILRVAAQRVHKVGAKVDRNQRITRLIHVSVQNLYRFWVRILLEMIVPYGRFIQKSWMLERVDDHETARFIPLAVNAGAWLTWICLRAWELRLRGAELPQYVFMIADDRVLTDFTFRIAANLREYMIEIIGKVTGKDHDVEIEYFHTAMAKPGFVGRPQSDNNGDYIDHIPNANNWNFPVDFAHAQDQDGDDYFRFREDFLYWQGWLHDRVSGPRNSLGQLENFYIKWDRARESYENLMSLRNWKQVRVNVTQEEPVATGAFLCDVVPREVERRATNDDVAVIWREVTSLSVYATRYLDKSSTDTASSMALCLYAGGDVQFWSSQATIERLMPGITTQRPWRSVPTQGMNWQQTGWNNCPNLKRLCPTINWDLDARENVGPVVHAYGALLCNDILRANRGIGIHRMAATSYNLTGACAPGILFEYRGTKTATYPQEETVFTRLGADGAEVEHRLFPTPWRTTPHNRWQVRPRSDLPANLYRWAGRRNPCVARDNVPPISPEGIMVVNDVQVPAWGAEHNLHVPVDTDGNWELTPVRCLYAALIHDDVTDSDVKAIRDEMISCLRKYEK